jgi:hypothetical protein
MGGPPKNRRIREDGLTARYCTVVYPQRSLKLSIDWCHECRRGYSAPVEEPLNAVKDRYDETTLPKRGRPPGPTNLSW